MTPNQFQDVALAWIGVTVVVGTSAIVAYFRLRGLIDSLKAKQKENTQRIDVHDSIQGVNTAPPAAQQTEPPK